MKKSLAILFLLFLLAATPSFAKQGEDKTNDQAKNNSSHQVQQQEVTCGPDEEYKNHGAYVSCVAKTHPGGQGVSAAAQSDIGKKHTDDAPTPTVNPSVTATITPTETPSVTPSLSPTEEPTPSATPTATITPEDEIQNAQFLSQEIKDLIKLLRDYIHSLLPNSNP